MPRDTPPTLHPFPFNDTPLVVLVNTVRKLQRI